jgi:CRISPR type III-B/RAMP module RAMP protein Cmr6
MAGPRPIPKDAAAALSTPGVLDECRNLGLLLERLNPWERRGNNWDLAFHVEERRRIQGQWQWKPATRWGGEAKGLWLSHRRDDNRTRLLDVPLLRHSHIDADLLKAHLDRWGQIVTQHGAVAGSDLRFDLRTQSRLVVGLGADSVLETSITLHRVYGFPIIPGNALKGLARTWALIELADKLGVPALDYERFQARKGPQVQNKRPTPLNLLEGLLEADLDTQDKRQQQALERALDKLKKEGPVQEIGGAILKMGLDGFRGDQEVRDFRAVFGYLGRAGSAIFFDAVPLEEPQLVADVMNVHYPDYYRDEKGITPPSDDQNPNPVSFLAVAEGTAFWFAVGGRRPNEPVDIACAKAACVWLKQGLSIAGIGAKTAAGYGFFGSRRRPRVGKARSESTIPSASPDEIRTKPKRAPERLSEEREGEIKSLADSVMRKLRGDGS